MGKHWASTGGGDAGLRRAAAVPAHFGQTDPVKNNAFDLVITVPLGSTLSNSVMSRQTGLADGLTGFATLIGLQFLVARLSVGSAGFRRLIKSEPSLLFFGGQLLKQAMHRQRVVEGEVLAPIRQAGISQLTDVQAVVLETDGSFTVVKISPSLSSAGPSSLDKLTPGSQPDATS